MKKIIIVLLCSLFVIGLQAQSQIKGVKSFETISSLIGKSITEVKALLKKEGLTESDKETDKDLNMDAYRFYRTSANEDDKTAYVVAIKNDKVLLVNVTYSYEDAEDETLIKADVIVMQKAMKANGFLYEEGADKRMKLYKNSQKNISGVVFLEDDWGYFSLIYGDTKLVLKVVEK